VKNTTAIILGLILLATTVRAQADAPARPVERTEIAVLPFANYSGSIRAIRTIAPMLDTTLMELGFKILPSDSLRGVLRENRIRTNGMINAADGEKIRQATGLDYLLVGSVDIFEEASAPEVGISIRILDLSRMRIIWTAIIGATGADHVGLFGVGRVDSVDSVARRAIREQLKSLSPAVLRANRSDNSKRIKCAVVPFEDYSKYPRAGEIATSLLASVLFESGYDVVEPGVVNEVMITGRSQSRGGVDYTIMDILREQDSVSLVLTGSVDLFQAARGNFEQSSPEVALGIRVVQTSSHKILAAYDKESTGSDSETLFELGGCHSLEKLTAGLLGELIHSFTTREGKRIADKN